MARVTLLGWVAFAVVMFLLAPPAPDPPSARDEEQATWQRMADWATRDAKQWQLEHGDLTIPWDEAEGHLVLIVDDVGRELDVFDKLWSLRFPLTFSVLPGATYAPGTQLRLRSDPRRYREIMLHLPMEPENATKMTEGAEATEEFLLGADTPQALRAKLDRALLRVPSAIAVNNHMGSRLTTEASAMEAIMPMLRERGLFFLDSRTTAETVAEQTARDHGVAALARNVFLDNDPRAESIAAALEDAAVRARAEPIVAIAHPTTAVFEALAIGLPALHEQGVGVYPLSEVLARRAK